MDEEVVVNGETYNIKCGAVVSRRRTAHYGYYECKFKANKTTLSTTFWFTTRDAFEAPGNCDNKYSQEWDIQECIGREGNFTGSSMAKGMHSNSHYWYSDCEGNWKSFNNGAISTIDEKLASDDFNVYGGWWKDENNASYYYNNESPQHGIFYNNILNDPFVNKMGMNMVVETYPSSWIELPSDIELADPEKNVSYYDWVRAYELVDAFEPYYPKDESILIDSNFEDADLKTWTNDEGWIYWGAAGAKIISNPEHVANGSYSCHLAGAGAVEQELPLKPHTEYKLTCNAKVARGTLKIGIKDNTSGEDINTINITDSNFNSYTFNFNSGSYSDIKFYYYAPTTNDEGYIDDVNIVEVNSSSSEENVPLKLYKESIRLGDSIVQNWTYQNIVIPLEFKTNEDREIYVTLTNHNNEVVAYSLHNAYAGYGNANINLQLDSVLSSDDYTLNVSLVSNKKTIDVEGDNVIHNQSTIIQVNKHATNVKSKKNIDLQIYPTLVSDYLYLKGIQPGETYHIYNINGRLITSNKYEDMIAVSSFLKGMYIIKTKRKRGKFIKI